MPEIGEIRYGREIGRSQRCKYIWQSCADCGKERWVQLVWGVPMRLRCISCSHKGIYPTKETKLKFSLARRGAKSEKWKGGRVKTSDNYVWVWLSPDDFFYPMAGKSGYVREHRLVMAKSLGRNLHLWEIVHHKNGIRSDNRIENLQLVSDDRHKQITILENRIGYLEKRVLMLEIENIKLKSDLLKEGEVNEENLL